jgi:hypothetical protein
MNPAFSGTTPSPTTISPSRCTTPTTATLQILTFGQAHVLALYDVSSQGSQVTVSAKNGTNPFTLTVNADESLSGSGTATINGRLMTALGDNANPVSRQQAQPARSVR